MPDDRRPSPEDLLARAAAEREKARRGRLKLFFGASPGVGKTYAMLEAAHARRRAGTDVVVGCVETHGRADTEALARALERVPVRTVDHRGVLLREMDLDAILARRPALVLVDELAHTNAPGSRHARRWQDVEELLAAGIDVHTTLNVQHVESLRDVVAGITGVTVQETVPDSILDRADEIELVDLSPDDLLRRMKEGKVYLPAQAERAMERFFTKGNLIALRELALRRTAERVDVEGSEWRQDQGIRRPWAARERLLVAVSPAPQSADLVRTAARMAARLKAPFLALSVETPAFDALSEEDRARVRSHLLLAGRLGAQTLVVRGDRVGDEILAAARANDVTRIVVGRPGRRRLSETWRPNLVDWLVRAAEGIDVLVAHVEGGGAGGRAPRRPVAPTDARRSLRPVLEALAIVAVVTALGLPIRGWASLADQAMLYVLGVLLAAHRLPRGATIIAALASVAALDFCFVPPYFTFAVADARYLITFSVLLVTALVVSGFTVRIRAQAAAAREREQRTAALYQASRALADAPDADAIAAVGVAHVAALQGDGVGVAFLPGPEGALRAVAGTTSSLAADPKELAVAAWVYANGLPAGRGTETLPAARGSYLPISGSGRPLGVLGLEAPLGRPSVRQLAETLVAQTGVALERAGLAATAASARVSVETERMRSALLSTVSHDLRTPLASITGAAGAILSAGDAMDDATRRGLLASIRDEGDRLGRLVSDLLDLTRLEGGALAVRKEWYPLEEVVASALQRTRPRLEGRDVRLDLPREVLLVRIDGVLLEQVVVNLLENAAKHTPAGSPVEIRLVSTEREASITVLDRGPGIPPGEEERIFEEFHRVDTGRPVEGAGLGLAVCRAIVRAHGGRIQATNRPGGGAAFRVTLPRDDAPPAPPEELADSLDPAEAAEAADGASAPPPAAPRPPEPDRPSLPRAPDLPP